MIDAAGAGAAPCTLALAALPEQMPSGHPVLAEDADVGGYPQPLGRTRLFEHAPVPGSDL